MSIFERERLKIIVSEYQKSVVQSEAEVRSKFIVPLLEFLQYPTELRAEEYPVYGFEGGSALPAKNADFILFSDKEFGRHRTATHADIEWVQNHSLLVFEAKKPGKMPTTMGQPAFYTIWTKAIAYLISDGETIKGYYYNMIAADIQVIECNISNLEDFEDIWNFSFENILRIKESGPSLSQNPIASKLTKACKGIEECVLLTSDEDINLPESTYAYMRQSLGKNAEGLGPLALVSKYTDEQSIYHLFCAVAEQGPDRRKNALKRFLELNSDYALFEKLPLLSLTYTGWGSLIPNIQRRIDYLNSLLPMLTGATFLKHRKKVEEDIESLKEYIKSEEVRELLESLG